MFHRWILFLVTPFFIVTLSFAAPAAEKIKVSVIDLVPLGWIKDGRYYGLYVEIIEALAKEAGFEPQIQLVPYLRAIAMVQSRDVDFTPMFDTNISQKMRTKKLEIYERTLYLFTLKGREFSSIKEISGPIGRMNGGCTDLDANVKIDVTNLNSFDQGILLLEKKRLRGICGTYSTLRSSLKKTKLTESEISMMKIKKKMISAHFHPEYDPKKFEKLKRALTTIKKNGTIQKIRAQYQDES